MKLPKGWKMKAIGDISDVAGGIQKGPHREASSNPVRYLTVAHVQRNRLLLDDPRYFEVTRAELERWRLRKGDVLIIEGNGSADQIGRTALFRGEIADCVHQNHVIRVRPLLNEVSGEYLNSLMNSSVGQAAVQLQSSTSSGLRTLSVGKIREMFFPLPPLPEQRKIADILATWDEALTQLDALIEAQERRKKALMQQLLTGKKRFPGFSEKWKKVTLGDVAENVADQNKGRMGTASLYGVTKAEGMVPMRDHVKGESFDRCKRVETDWFAYNPMRINIGSIARWQGTETVMVSGDYVVFRCNPNRLLPAYLDHLRQSWMWQSFVTRGGNGSVRIRIYFSDLAEFTLPCPPLEEQRQIAAILDTADQQLTLLRTQRTALDQQKRGLMQRLLTGRVRVGGG